MASVFLDAVEYRSVQSQATGVVSVAAGASHFLPVVANQLVTAKAYFSGFAGITKQVYSGARLAIRYLSL